MLCDLHLNSNKQKSAVHDIEKRFTLEGYKFIHNSEGPSRGVGILLHKNLRDDSFNINNVRRDREGNYILLDINIKNNRYTVGSVYGPNYDEQVNMYDNLVSSCRELKNEKIILGGDVMGVSMVILA
jgi:exonuclease III